MGKLTINVLFNSYVSLPEGNPMMVGWIPNLPTSTVQGFQGAADSTSSGPSAVSGT